MSARVKFEGLDELRAELRRLPMDLRDDGAAIVLEHANGAADEIRAGYPRRTGNLKEHVKVQAIPANSNFGSAVAVKSTAKHAFIFENGTQTRKNNLGANRGAMPPGRVFVPVMIRRRRQMLEDLKDLVRRAGLEVRG